MLATRSFRALTALALLLAAPAALAGDIPIETSVGKTFTLKFGLDFKLTCKHDYLITFDPPGSIELVNPPVQTSSTNFKARAVAVGMVTASVTFMGPGGNCNGMASAMTDVIISPDPKYTEKAWKTQVKDSDKAFRSLLKDLDKDFVGSVDNTLDAFKLEEISSSEAVDELFSAAEEAIGSAAWGGYLSLQTLSDTGTTLLEDGGLTSSTNAFMTGTPGSLWTQATYDVAEDYDNFAEDVYDDFAKAMSTISKARGSFTFATWVNGDFPFDMPAGPGVEGDPVDVDLASVAIMGGVAFNDAGTGALRWFGSSAMDGGDVSIDPTGPTGATVLAVVTTPVEYAKGSPFGKWSVSFDGLSVLGQYRLLAGYDSEALSDYKVTISLPFAPPPVP